jgi:pyridoxamine 5'-phosphate oxidase
MKDSNSEETSRHHDAGMDISSLRLAATGLTLEQEDLDPDPMNQFEDWFREACDASALEPNAMSLTTVNEQHQPFCRTVLLKYFDERGFVFFTNQSSNKAKHIAGNSNVALLFFWPVLGRQIIIRGRAEKISTKETMRYFVTRPRGSQIGAWVSVQSQVITSRALLEEKFAEMKSKFADKKVPLPSFWGGYRVLPIELEFWQGRADRLHDRFQYSDGSDGSWNIERLSP